MNTSKNNLHFESDKLYNEVEEWRRSLMFSVLPTDLAYSNKYLSSILTKLISKYIDVNYTSLFEGVFLFFLSIYVGL